MSTETKHTPEPWEIHVHRHVGGDYWASIGHNGRGPICDTTHFAPAAQFRHLVTDEETQKANGERICACVNAMRGIDDPEAFVTDVIDLFAASPSGRFKSSDRHDLRKHLAKLLEPNPKEPTNE